MTTGVMRGGLDPSALGRRPRRRHDWAGARVMYVEGRASETGQLEFPTLQQVAEEFNIASGLLRSRAGREGWRAERQIFVTHLERVRQAQRATDLAAASWVADEKALEAASVGLRAVRERLESLDAAVDGQRGRAFSAELRDLARLATEFYSVVVQARGGSVVSR